MFLLPRAPVSAVGTAFVSCRHICLIIIIIICTVTARDVSMSLYFISFNIENMSALQCKIWYKDNGGNMLNVINAVYVMPQDYCRVTNTHLEQSNHSQQCLIMKISVAFQNLVLINKQYSGFSG